ncbi:ABC transporter ATP-binding protein [Pseudoflavitalea sp. G-6-1-2]|uniref:ABC transporter ATP-binding protein n=1 Tax=Pseudoflavitalea sp. G-6-1-2 TaxID=2728841 RepID=UPI001469EB31|nr:ABC transporter ATP-binding protein [Pseudoflavitalea sp. G-6-1-2]NML20854.1 ABC transporter ATP-binding protein [Pseudoflavitalea sp. G-6-1-2]
MRKNNIIIQNLHIRYGKKSVLHDVNMEFPANKFSVLLGANGSGKSTLFRAIAGLHAKYEGSITIAGANSAAMQFKERAKLMGFLPQFYQTVFPFTVEEIMLTGRVAFSGFSPAKHDRELLEQVLHDLDLTHLRKEPFTVLSGGEQQMIMIGRLLMQNPKIIVMDEPTNHLDVYYQNYLMRKLKAYANNGVTVIAIMHNPTLAYQYADEFFFMNNGTVINSEQCSIPDLERLQEVYKTEFLHVEHNNLKIVLPNLK